MPLYYEDFTVGQKFNSRHDHTIRKKEAVAFAKRFDPQMQHTDVDGAKQSVFGGLVVSGWYTATLTMKLHSETDLFSVAGGLVGLGIDELRWPKPTKPGDTLHLVITVVEKRMSKSQPGNGIIQYRAEMLNQRGEIAMKMLAGIIVPCKSPDIT